jgi:hypothetical protein
MFGVTNKLMNELTSYVFSLFNANILSDGMVLRLNLYKSLVK